MTKNSQGGNKQKKFARKNTSQPMQKSLRTATSDGEVYAIVTKMLGNNMFSCWGIDDNERLGYIRGKFCGRKKHHNFVSVGMWVLVGDRGWEKTKRNADLLEIYTEENKQQLMRHESSLPWSILHSKDVTKEATASAGAATVSDIHFMTEKDVDMERLAKDNTFITMQPPLLTAVTTTTTTTAFAATEEELDSICVDNI